MKKIILIISSILIFGLITALAQNTENDNSISAWVEDKELEKDIFIRDKPNGFGKILGEIPFVMEDDDKVIVSIKGYSKGWLQIKTAVKKDETVIFSGEGWIKANRVNAKVFSPQGKKVYLYALPKIKSKKAGTVSSNAQFEVIGYHYFGLKIRFKGKIGWLQRTNICGNPFTSC